MGLRVRHKVSGEEKVVDRKSDLHAHLDDWEVVELLVIPPEEVPSDGRDWSRQPRRPDDGRRRYG